MRLAIWSVKRFRCVNDIFMINVPETIYQSSSGWLITEVFQNDCKVISLRMELDHCFDLEAEESSEKYKVNQLFLTRFWTGSLGRFLPIAYLIKILKVSVEKGKAVSDLGIFDNLEELTIGGKLSEIDFTHFKKLQLLHITSKQGKGNWGECVSLRDIYTQIPLLSLEPLSKLIKLESLGCERLDSLAGIMKLSSLSDLRFSTRSLSSLDSAEPLPSLQELLIDCSPKLESLNGIECFGNLESLSLDSCNKLEDLSPIHGLKHLKYLKVEGCRLINNLNDVEVPIGCDVLYSRNSN